MIDEAIKIFTWLLLPPLASKFFLNIYYSLFFIGQRRPKPQSLQYKKHFRLTHTVILSVYFCYCIGSFFTELPKSYYAVLGSNRQDSQIELRSNFRRIIVDLHPDKVKYTGHSEKFENVRSVYEVLSDPESRMVYDVYGPTVLHNIKKTSGQKKYELVRSAFVSAIIELSVFYGISILLSILLKRCTIFRITSLLAFATLELYVVARPSEFSAPYIGVFDNNAVVYLWNSYPTHQKIALWHQLWLYGSLIQTHLTGYFADDNPQSENKIIENIALISKHNLAIEASQNLDMWRKALEDSDEDLQNVENEIEKLALQLSQ